MANSSLNKSIDEVVVIIEDMEKKARCHHGMPSICLSMFVT